MASPRAEDYDNPDVKYKSISSADERIEIDVEGQKAADRAAANEMALKQPCKPVRPYFVGCGIRRVAGW